MGKLVLQLPDGRTLDIPLDRERITIGRRADNDICLPYPAVSGEHAAVVTILDDSFLEDLNSTNGTLVNGKSIAKHFLRERDEIDIGRQTLVYYSDAEVRSDRQDDGVRSGRTLRPSRAQRKSAPKGDAAPAPARRTAAQTPPDGTSPAAMDDASATGSADRPPAPVAGVGGASAGDAGDVVPMASFAAVPDREAGADSAARAQSAPSPASSVHPAPAPDSPRSDASPKAASREPPGVVARQRENEAGDGREGVVDTSAGEDPRGIDVVIAGDALLGEIPEAPMAIKILAGPSAGRAVAMNRDEMLIGRVGERIVAVRRDGARFNLVPLEGTGPVLLNGQPLPVDGAPLARGDRFELADALLEFVNRRDAE